MAVVLACMCKEKPSCKCILSGVELIYMSIDLYKFRCLVSLVCGENGDATIW